MTVAETSLKAFQKKKEEGSLQGDKEKVYNIIKKNGPITCKKTAQILGKYPNEISGRFTELRNDHDMIEISGTRDGHRQYQVKNQE